MKIRTQFIATLVVFFALINNAKAQYVTIPDPEMVAWLTADYPSSMNGNQFDTTNYSVVNENAIQISGTVISNLDGIQYFDNLDTLICVNIGLSTLQQLPNSLQYLDCKANLLSTWPSLPNSLHYLDCSMNINISTLPPLPNSLLSFICENNNILSLPLLPNSLQHLHCGGNNITTLPSLPDSIKSLKCWFNNLTILPILPVGLKVLDCSGNNLVIWPQIPSSLLDLDCISTNISTLPQLPNSLQHLHCGHNNLTTLPTLPDSLQFFSCQGNNLTSLPTLPNHLQYLVCCYCNLISLPQLPNSLKYINCNYNDLTSIPSLPTSLQYLECNNNDITNLTSVSMPNSLLEIDCSYNPNLSCLPILPNTLEGLAYYNTSITCLPNYPNNSIFQTLLPICLPNNVNGCETTEFISGAFFNNSNNSCINNANITTNAALKLYDDQNNFLQSHSASSDDHYYFSIDPGNYVVRVDSSFFTNGVNLSCPVLGEHNVTALIDSSYTDRDFGLNCVGIDLGVEAILPQGIVFPGQPHSLKAIAGDLSNYFGLNCAAGTGGTVEITVTGPVTYVDYPSTALTPIVNGTTFTYSISDFSNVNLQEAFVLNFLTNTTAQATNLISVTAQITSNAIDLDLTNNATSFSYFVVNSYDPNMKEVNPVNVLPGYDDYFTYTVHFQNMGNAPAFNIKIKDTLDQNLDFETFRVINASHPYSYNLTGDLLNVYFPNIMLADSTSDPEGSKGFVQYQVKPKANLPLGTTIENTAHIYFDFNPAVVTNTTTNEFVQTLGLTEDAFGQWSIAPNPNKGVFSIQLKQSATEQLNVFVLDSQGRKVMQETVPAFSKTCTLQTALASGVYFLQLSNGNKSSEIKRVVVE